MIVPFITPTPEPSPYFTPIPSCENEEELETYTSITYPIMDSLTKAAQEATQLEAMSESRAKELLGETQQYYLQLSSLEPPECFSVGHPPLIDSVVLLEQALNEMIEKDFISAEKTLHEVFDSLVGAIVDISIVVWEATATFSP